MNSKKFIISFIANFIFIFIFGFLWWGKLMHGAHQEVPALWRPEAEFGNHFPILILGHAVVAFFFTLVFVRGFGSGGGVGGGFRYGILIGLMVSGSDCITYAVQPLTTTILWGWIAGDLLMFAIAGLIVGALYKPGPAPGGVV
jgi:hypothetical protein